MLPVLEGQDKVCDGCPVEKAFSDGKSHTSERKTVMPSGEVITWETRANPIRDSAGKIVSCLEIARDITEHKKAEQALADEATRRRILADQSLDGIVVLDENAKVYEANQRFAEMLGYTPEEVRELHTWDWDKNFPPEKILELGRNVDEKGLHLETKHTRKDGSVIDVDISINGAMCGGQKLIFCVCRDITERKQVEEKVQHLNLVLRAIRNVNQLIATGTDRDGLLKGACDTLVKTRGYYSAWIALLDESGKLVTAAEAGLGKSFLPVMEKLKRGELTHCGRKVLEKPGVLVIKDVSSECDDCPLAKEDTGRDAMSVRLEYGGKVYGLMTVSILPGRAVEKEEQDLLKEIVGDIAFALHSMEQEQERKQTEEALQAEKNKLQSLIDAMEDTITIQDTEYNIIYQNEPSRIAAGGDHLGEKCYRVYEGREKICDGCPVEKAFKDGKSHTTERKTTISGEVAFWENTANPIRDAEGRIVSCLELARDITERKKQEQTLQAEKNKLQSVIDAMADALTIQDMDYNIIFQNEHSKKSTGGDRLGEKCYRAYEGRESICEDCPVEKAFKDGKPHVSERQRVLPSGELSFWENTSNPIRDAQGRVVACLEIGRNITERKKQEQALADELTRRRLLVDQSLDGIVVLDADAKVVEANQRFADMLGYTLEEVRELHTWDWDKAFPPEKILEMGRNVDEKGLHLETQHTRKDGSVIDVDISISGIMYGGQKLIFCIGRDITERKKMEEALKLAAEEWRNTFDSISDAISIHDRDFQILRANKAFADMYHVKPRQIIGKHCYELHSGKKPISGCPHKQTLATGKPAMAEFYESHLGKYLLESTSPILNEKGEVVATVHVTRDITERKQQSERLMMADRLASVGELAAGAAHELNNPLTSVIGFSQLLMEKDIPDDIREDVKLIHDEAQRAANVTKNLLTFARKHAPVKQLTQINSIIEDVLKLRTYEHKVNSIEVKKQLDPNIPEIMVDPFQMQQVFLNIIINAEYFMIAAHKRGTLTITTKRQNGTVKISFADDGPGIPPENLNRIFDPFFTTKEAGKGTGLGLSICHGIVSEHGGQIYARSQLGKGATIIVELPVNTP